MLWTQGAKPVRDEILRGLIGLGHQVDGPLEPHVVRLTKAVAEDLTGITGDLRRLVGVVIQDRVHCGESPPFPFGLAWHERQPRVDISFPANEIAATDDPGGRAGDHRRVVGAIREPWIGNRHAGPTELENFLAEPITEQRIGRYATGENDGASAELERGSRGLDRQRLDDRFLESGGEVGDGSIRRGTTAPGAAGRVRWGSNQAQSAGSRSLSGTRIGSVNLRSAVLRPEKLKSCVPAQPGARQIEGARVTLAGGVLDGGATREAEPKQARTFVKRLAGGVVQRAPEVAKAAVACHQDELGMAAGDEQAEDGKDRFLWQIGCVAQPIGVDVRLEVVDRDERTAERVGHPFGGIHAHDQCTSEPGSLGDGNGVDFLAIDACLPQSLLDHRDDGRHMASRGKLGHDAAVAFVEVELRRHNRGQNPATSGNDCRRRFVTRCFDAKHDHGNSRSGRNVRAVIRSIRLGLPGPGMGRRFLAPSDDQGGARVRRAAIRPRRDTPVHRAAETT